MNNVLWMICVAEPLWSWHGPQVHNVCIVELKVAVSSDDIQRAYIVI